jgi:thioredoxin-related protein
MKTLLLVCAFFTATLTASAVEPLKWTTDYKAALAQAKEQNRHVFLFFTGSDWCIWCKRLNQEILSKPEFAQYAADKLILVELDYPQTKSLPRKLKAQNAKLLDEYKIEAYPTVVVLDSNGKTLGQLGYQEGGPQPFIAALSKF